MKFPDLITQISKIAETARLGADRTLQQTLSLRNWLIGDSIVEFEHAGEDRAQYGQRLMRTLAQALGEAGCQGLSASNLKNFRQLAVAYPRLDAINLGRRLSLPIAGDHASGIRQTSGEFAPDPENRQTSYDAIDLAIGRLAKKIDARSVPVIVEMTSLDDMGCQIRVEQPDAFACWIADARIDQALGGGGVKSLPQTLRLGILSRIESLGMGRIAAAQVVKIAVDVEQNFPKLGRPARRLAGVCHEPGMMVGRLKQRRLEFTADIEHTEPSTAETGRSISAHVGERRHEVARPGSCDPTCCGHEVDVADGLHQARIGLLFRRNQQRPVLRICDVLKQIDRRIDTADDSDGTSPFDS